MSGPSLPSYHHPPVQELHVNTRIKEEEIIGNRWKELGGHITVNSIFTAY